MTFCTGKAQCGAVNSSALWELSLPFPQDEHAALLISSDSVPLHPPASNFVLSPSQDLAPKGWPEWRP